MSIQLVRWTSSKRLACAGCAISDVILCLKNPELVAPKDCPDSELLDPTSLEDSYQRSTIEATLMSATPVKNSCGGMFWAYQFQFENEQLVPGTNLAAADIEGVVCNGCLTKYMEDLVGNDVVLNRTPATELEPEHLVLTTEHGCRFKFYEGFGVVTESDDCSIPGIGAGKSITAVTVSGGELTITAAEMPIAISANFSDIEDPGVTLDGTGDFPISTFGPYEITNESECLSATVDFSIFAHIAGNFAPEVALQTFLTLTGDIATTQRRDYTNVGAEVYAGHLQDVLWNQSIVIPPATTYTFTVDISVSVINLGTGDSTVTISNQQTAVTGFTSN